MTALNHPMLQCDFTKSKRPHSFGAFSSSSSASLYALYGAPQLSRTTSVNAMALYHSTSMLSTMSNAGGPMRRSQSKSALFNEDVLEVSLLKSPARKTNIRMPYKTGVQGVQGGLSELSHELSDGVQAHMHAQPAQQQVAILDRLQARQLFVNVNQTHTIEYLKKRIQSKQGQDGLRIIPAHIQVIIFNGRECLDEEKVWGIMMSHDVRNVRYQGGVYQGAVFTVEPRVNELVSFFLASVSDLSRQQGFTPKDQRELSPTTSCADATFAQPVSLLSLDPDADDTHFFGEGMEGLKDDCISLSPSTPSSPRSMSSPAAPLSPVLHGDPEIANSAFILGAQVANMESHTHTPSRSLYCRPRMEVGSLDVLSSKTTPTADWMCDLMCQDLGLIDNSGSMKVGSMASSIEVGSMACSFDGFSSMRQMMLCAGAPPSTPTRTPSMVSSGVSLDMVELRKWNKGNYSSESHILFRGDREACLQQLPWPKFEAMQSLVLEVQSGLRHGHVPEELSTSGRDSLSLQQSLPDSSWEEERASWWAQMQLEGQSNGIITDFDYGELVQNCCGGTYMMRNSRGAQSAVFKPMDEEPYAPSNPKGFIGIMNVESGMKAGVTVGGGALRECAAFLLDHGGLCAVPCTAMLRITHTTLLADGEAEVQIKVGSLQRFQQHDCTAEDVGTAGFDLKQLHAIGVLDVRTFNMDRNSDNLLVKLASTSSGFVQLVPIDHGYILPSFKHLEEVHACWLHWPQAKEPYSEEMLDYIDTLDAEKDMRLLRSTLALDDDCLLTLFTGTTLIQTAARKGLTLHQTGMLMVREASDRPSAIEQVVADAVWAAESDGFVSTAVCEDYYASLKLHLKEFIGQLVCARLEME